MSVLANQTNATPGDAFFWTVTASTITAKTFSSDRVLTDTLSTGSITVGAISTTGSIVVSGDITAQNLTATDTLTSYFANVQYLDTIDGANIGGLLIASNIAGYDTIFYPRADISTISTSHIILDGNTLDTGGAGLGATLLLNGIPVVTTSTSISSLVQWAVYPAVSTVILDNNNIVEVNQLETQTLSAFDANIDNDLFVNQKIFGNQSEFQEVITQDLAAVTLEALSGSISTLGVSTLTTNSVVIPTGTFSNLNATNLNTTNITAVAGSIADFGATTATINQLNASNATVSGTLTQNEVRGVNGFINEEAANRIRIRVLGSSDIFSSPELDLEAGGGNRGIVNLIANPGFGGIQGECTVSAKGGSAAGYATGGLLNLTAERGTSVLGTASYSRVGIAADSITSYAGGPTPFAGIYGYNFLYGLLGVNIVAATPPTLPNVPGTVYLYGLNPLGVGSSGGVRINNGLSVDVLYPYPQGFIAPEYDLIIRGNPAGQKVTLSNVRYIFGDGTIATGFADLLTTNLSATNLNGTNIFGTNYLASNVNISSGTISSLTTQNGFVQGLNVSSLNGYTVQQLLNPALQSSFQQVFTSSLQANSISTNIANINQITGVSTLNGYTVEQLISSVSPLVFFSTVSSFQQLYTSSLQANTISTNTANINQITGVSTLNGFTVEQLVSTVSPPTPAPSTFQQLFTSSLQAQNVSTINLQTLDITGLSTINGFSVADFVSSIGPPPIITSTFTQLNTSSLVASNVSTQVLNAASVQLNGIPLTPQASTFGFLSTDLFQANQISSGLLVASSINGYTIQQLLNPQVQSSFQTLFASTATIFELFVSSGTIFNASNLVLNVSSINGFNTSQFLSTSGTQGQISTFSTLTTNLFQANQISSGLFVASSINGFTIQQLINPVVSTVSTFQQLFTSSIQTNNLSTNTGNILSLNGVSTINGFTIADFVSSVSPQPPIPSTVFQFFTSSLAANSVTNYQTSNLSLIAPTVIVSTNSLVENADNYNLTVTSNIDINSSNAINIYNTNTAPTIGTNDVHILGQGTTTLAGQGNTNVTAINNLLLNAGQITTVQGLEYVVINTSQQLQLNGSNEISATSSNIRLNGNLVINGVPYNPNATSSFTTLATDVLRNNTTNNLMITAPFGVNLSTGNQVLITSGEVLTYSRGITDFFATTGIALSTQIIRLDAPITNVQGTLNAPQIITSSIVGNTITAPLQFVSTLYTNTLRNNDSLGNELNIIAAYPSISSIATLIEGQNIALLATDEGTFTAQDLYISTGDTYIDGDVALTNSLTVKALSNLSSINGLPYTPGGGGGVTVSTFQQLFTSSIVLNTINGAAYPPPASQTVSTFQQLFTTNFYAQSSITSTLTVADSVRGNNLIVNGTTTLGLTGQLGMVIQTASNNIVLSPGILDPGDQEVQIAPGNLNLCNNDIYNVANITLTNINGAPYAPLSTVSTFQQLFTSSILMNTGTFCNLFALGTDPKITSEDDFSIQASNTLALTGQQGLGIVTLSNDITIAAGFVGPGEVRITASPLNLCNFDINNVAVLNATTINNTTLNNTTINTVTLNGRTATLSTMNAEIANISSGTISTINNYPYHKAFGTAWATGTTPMVGGVPVGVDWGGTHYFNLSDIISGEASLLPGIQPRNIGVYQANARATFSNSDSVVATASAYLTIDGYDDPISRVSVEIEPSRTGSAIITWQGYIGENISLSVYSDNSNIQLYEYPAGGPYPPYRAYCANITMFQLYSYEGGGAWPPNPLITPEPT
jgi:hypothetical protein